MSKYNLELITLKHKTKNTFPPSPPKKKTKTEKKTMSDNEAVARCLSERIGLTPAGFDAAARDFHRNYTFDEAAVRQLVAERLKWDSPTASVSAGAPVCVGAAAAAADDGKESIKNKQLGDDGEKKNQAQQHQEKGKEEHSLRQQEEVMDEKKRRQQQQEEEEKKKAAQEAKREAEQEEESKRDIAEKAAAAEQAKRVAEVEAAIEQIRDRVRELQKQVDGGESKRRDMLDQLDRLLTQRDAMDKKLRELQQELENTLKKELQVAEDDVKKKNDAFATAQTKLDGAMQLLETLRAELAVAQQTMTELLERADVAATALLEAEAKVRLMSQLEQQATTQLSDAERRHGDAEQRRDTATREVADQEGVVREREDDLQTMKDRHKLADDDLADAVADLASTVAELNEAKKQLVTAQAARRAADEKVCALEAEIINLGSETNQLKAEIERLNSVISQFERPYTTGILWWQKTHRPYAGAERALRSQLENRVSAAHSRLQHAHIEKAAAQSHAALKKDEESCAMENKNSAVTAKAAAETEKKARQAAVKDAIASEVTAMRDLNREQLQLGKRRGVLRDEQQQALEAKRLRDTAEMKHAAAVTAQRESEDRKAVAERGKCDADGRAANHKVDVLGKAQQAVERGDEQVKSCTDEWGARRQDADAADTARRQKHGMLQEQEAKISSATLTRARHNQKCERLEKELEVAHADMNQVRSELGEEHRNLAVKKKELAPLPAVVAVKAQLPVENRQQQLLPR